MPRVEVITSVERRRRGSREEKECLQLDDWQPTIWRRAEVPLTATLKALHDVIQAAMPFDAYHLFESRADGKRYAIPDPEWDSLRDKIYSAKTMRLGTLVDRGITQLTYT